MNRKKSLGMREKREQGRKTGRCSGSEVRQPPDRQTDTDETGK